MKSTVISSPPNWLRSIEKRGNMIQSLSASNRDWIIQSKLLFHWLLISDQVYLHPIVGTTKSGGHKPRQGFVRGDVSQTLVTTLGSRRCQPLTKVLSLFAFA